MSTLAQSLNAPTEMTIRGHSLMVKRLSISQVYESVQAALKQLDGELKGVALQNESQKCLETGNFPMRAIELLMWKAMKDCNDGLTMEDVEALALLESLEDAVKIVQFAIGLEEESGKKKEVTEQ